MITIKTRVKDALRKLDQLSPYPLMYPFVMSENEKRIFDDAVKESHHYLEFGLGGSTIRAIQKSKANVYTVESSPDWINRMRQYVFLRLFEDRRLQIFPVDIGPVLQWGYPASTEHIDLFERYSASVFQSVDCKLIDLALVDGRFRVACTLKVILSCHANERIRILIHDFWNRPQYHILLKYLDPLTRADSIGLFAIKSDIDLTSVEQDYETYKLSPA